MILNRVIDCSLEMEDCFCLCFDLLGRLSATLSEYQQAIQWIDKAIDIMMHPLHTHRQPLDAKDIIILREKMKIVQILFLGNQWRECSRLACHLRREMRPFVDCHFDEDYRELESIIRRIDLSLDRER
jgi:hypothetical protein